MATTPTADSTVSFDDSLIRPCDAWAAHLYDEAGILYEVEGQGYFVATQGSITRITLSVHAPWLAVYSIPLRWQAEVWACWDGLCAHLAPRPLATHEQDVVTRLVAVMQA